MDWLFERCSTCAADVVEAEKAGAGRVELCAELAVGGVTPSTTEIRRALAASHIPVNVLIRPRSGDFVYNDYEVAEMVSSILVIGMIVEGDRRVNGVVIGALDEEGDVDYQVVRILLDAAEAARKADEPRLEITFHRAIDVCRDPLKALEDVISLGCDRILTSGHEDSSYDGQPLLKKMVERAGDRIIILVGGGVRHENVAEIAAFTGAKEFHSSHIL